MKQTFPSFREASKFASTYCREHSCSAQLSRENDAWVVTIDAPQSAPPVPRQHAKEWLPYDEWKKQNRTWLPHEEWRRKQEEDLERIRQEEQRIADEYTKRVREKGERDWHSHRDEQEARRQELSAKKSEILELARSGILGHERLQLVIDNQKLYGFSESELAELLELLQPTRSSQVPSICPSCHMVDSNCTCGRSWF